MGNATPVAYAAETRICNNDVNLGDTYQTGRGKHSKSLYTISNLSKASASNAGYEEYFEHKFRFKVVVANFRTEIMKDHRDEFKQLVQTNINSHIGAVPLALKINATGFLIEVEDLSELDCPGKDVLKHHAYQANLRIRGKRTLCSDWSQQISQRLCNTFYHGSKRSKALSNGMAQLLKSHLTFRDYTGIANCSMWIENVSTAEPLLVSTPLAIIAAPAQSSYTIQGFNHISQTHRQFLKQCKIVYKLTQNYMLKLDVAFPESNTFISKKFGHNLNQTQRNTIQVKDVHQSKKKLVESHESKIKNQKVGHGVIETDAASKCFRSGDGLNMAHWIRNNSTTEAARMTTDNENLGGILLMRLVESTKHNDSSSDAAVAVSSSHKHVKHIHFDGQKLLLLEYINNPINQSKSESNHVDAMQMSTDSKLSKLYCAILIDAARGYAIKLSPENDLEQSKVGSKEFIQDPVACKVDILYPDGCHLEVYSNGMKRQTLPDGTIIEGFSKGKNITVLDENKKSLSAEAKLSSAVPSIRQTRSILLEETHLKYNFWNGYKVNVDANGRREYINPRKEIPCVSRHVTLPTPCWHSWDYHQTKGNSPPSRRLDEIYHWPEKAISRASMSDSFEAAVEHLKRYVASTSALDSKRFFDALPGLPKLSKKANMASRSLKKVVESKGDGECTSAMTERMRSDKKAGRTGSDNKNEELHKSSTKSIIKDKKNVRKKNSRKKSCQKKIVVTSASVQEDQSNTNGVHGKALSQKLVTDYFAAGRAAAAAYKKAMTAKAQAALTKKEDIEICKTKSNKCHRTCKGMICISGMNRKTFDNSIDIQNSLKQALRQLILKSAKTIKPGDVVVTFENVVEKGFHKKFSPHSKRDATAEIGVNYKVLLLNDAADKVVATAIMTTLSKTLNACESRKTFLREFWNRVQDAKHL